MAKRARVSPALILLPCSVLLVTLFLGINRTGFKGVFPSALPTALKPPDINSLYASVPLPEPAGHGPINPRDVLGQLHNPPGGGFPGRLVLGLASGYDLSQLRMFYLSVQKKMPEAWVVFFVDKLPEGLTGTLDRVSFQLWHRPKKPTFFAEIDPEGLRFMLYEAFLADLPAGINRYIILCDTRDVVFLGNVFDQYNDNSLHFFAETTKMMLGDERTDRSWITICYGEKARPLFGFPLVNAGFMMGPAAYVSKLCAALRKELVRNRCLERQNRGMDQVSFMYLLYTGQLFAEGLEFHLEFNPTGRVLLGNECYGDYDLVNGTIANKLDQEYLAIHMWDRISNWEGIKSLANIIA